jgi:hypothetical protein
MSTASVLLPQSRFRLAGIFRSVAASLRFSLRELFLVTMVCAALAAWLHEVRKQQRPLTRSHIADYFATGLQNDVVAARSKAGEKGAAWSFAPAACMDITGVWKEEHCLNREWFCDLHLPWEKARTFHEDLLRRINGHIRQGQVGEHVSTSEYEAGTTIDSPDFYGDSTKYHCGDIHGTIRVYLVRTGNQQAQIVAVLNEHRVP